MTDIEGLSNAVSQGTSTGNSRTPEVLRRVDLIAAVDGEGLLFIVDDIACTGSWSSVGGIDGDCGDFGRLCVVRFLLPDVIGILCSRSQAGKFMGTVPSLPISAVFPRRVIGQFDGGIRHDDPGHRGGLPRRGFRGGLSTGFPADEGGRIARCYRFITGINGISLPRSQAKER